MMPSCKNKLLNAQATFLLLFVLSSHFNKYVSHLQNKLLAELMHPKL